MLVFPFSLQQALTFISLHTLEHTPLMEPGEAQTSAFVTA